MKLPEKVKQDTQAYRAQVERYVRGELSPVAFRAYRVPMGVYEQRTVDTYMVRIRIGAGLATSRQLDRIAELSRRHGNGILHVTTRQDVQIHDVRIEQTPDVLEGLLEVDLSSRGGGGNTVRNVTACPHAGFCPFEQFDVTPYAPACAQYLLQFDSSYNLPRKYKIAFSGCGRDCAYASVADLGFFAHVRDGVRGFSVYAGGGLGSHPAVAVKMEDFVPPSEVFEVAEAIKRLFDKHGDRSNKHKARLRYVLARLGPEAFVRLYTQERERVRAEGLEGAIPIIADVTEVAEPGDLSPGEAQEIAPPAPDLLCEKRRGYYSIKLTLPLGDVAADDLREIAEVARRYGAGLVRTTQQQDLLIPSVREAHVDEALGALRGLSADVLAGGVPKVVACAGAATCKLGLCLSRGLADAIADKLAETPAAEAGRTTIRISGCPNSCGHHYLGDLGFQGRAKRVGGRLLPCYDVLAAAQTVEGAARLAGRVGTLPARIIPEFVAELFAEGAPSSERTWKLVEKYAGRVTGEIPEEYYFDWGADVAFSLSGRGPGECGAGVMDVIGVDIEQAWEMVKRCRSDEPADKKSRDLYDAVLASARALLVIFGAEPRSDREIFDAFGKHLIEPGWVEPATQQLLHSAIDWRMGDRDTLVDMHEHTERLVERVEKLFLSLDANLKFRLEPVGAVAVTSAAPGQRVDLRGVPCPLNFVKAKLAVESIGLGDVIEIALDEGEPIENVPGSLTGQGQEIVETRKIEDHFLLTVRRCK